MGKKKTILYISAFCIVLTAIVVGNLYFFIQYNSKISQKDSQITTLNNKYTNLLQEQEACPFGELYCIKDNDGKLTPLFSGDIYRNIKTLKDSKGAFYDYQELLFSVNPADNTFSIDIQNGIIIKGTYIMDTNHYTYTLEYDADYYNFDKLLKFEIVGEYILKYVGDSITPEGPTYGDDYGFVIHID